MLMICKVMPKPPRFKLYFLKFFGNVGLKKVCKTELEGVAEAIDKKKCV